jgi:hypothetical protein
MFTCVGGWMLILETIKFREMLEVSCAGLVNLQSNCEQCTAQIDIACLASEFRHTRTHLRRCFGSQYCLAW